VSSYTDYMKKSNFLYIFFLSGIILLFGSFTEIFAQESNIILLPTDDAYVAVDLANLDDTVTELNTGNFGHLQIIYSFNVADTKVNLVSLGHLKFDLSELNLDDITSATLNLNAVSSNVQDNTLSVFKGTHNDWDESSLTFKNKPAFLPTAPIDFTDRLSPTNWIQWDVTNVIKQNNSTDITFVISFGTLKQGSQEEINFHSKESTIPNSSPFLEVEIGSIPEIPEQSEDALNQMDDYTIKELPVIEDAFVISNYNDPQDISQLQSINTGNYNFTKIWYANNAAGNGELIVTAGFMKFDLSELDSEKIIDAKLQMFSTGVFTTDTKRIISISTVSNSTWNESELNFTNKPEFIKEIAFAEISTGNDWISWNVTDVIKENAGSEITLSASYSKFFPGSEEQTIFNSKESTENTPYIEIVYDEPSNGGGCLIATATYGSELAPQVQQLRELRDNQLLQTNSGTLFMESFNDFYYSFSPYIADYERENPAFKEIVKLGITPMLTSLSILNYVDIDSEQEMLGYGISIILLNVGMYLGAPAMLLYKARKLYNL